jgi:hypothetical protein
MKTKFKTSELPVFFFHKFSLEFLNEDNEHLERGVFDTHTFEEFQEFIDKCKQMDMVVMYPQMKSFEILPDGRLKFFGWMHKKNLKQTVGVY